jgi:1-acyl-sn-glycerol-3-phosphate acyltransferase
VTGRVIPIDGPRRGSGSGAGRTPPARRSSGGAAGGSTKSTSNGAANAVAAGAGRAAGERARRRRTPLLPEIEPAVDLQPEGTVEREIPAQPVVGAEPEVEAQRASGAGSRVPFGLEAKAAELLAFLRRRAAGDYEVDEFGYDADLADHVLLPALRPLYKQWFRVDVRGIENIPSHGGALVVGNHSGTIAVDSLMTQVAVHDEHPDHRHLRMLGADIVFQAPFIGELARKGGSTLATNSDAERLLSSGELVGVWPEGFKGTGKPFSERYKLQRFGRGGFVSAALRAGVPIIPCSIVGAEEIYPIFGDIKPLARLLGMPYVPITPTFPLLGPLGLIPLPSKWIIEFGAPIETSEHDAAAADDPMLVFDLTDQVRETIQQTLYSLLMQRRSVFF